MNIETFQLERNQSLWENHVEFNLTETGVHPFALNELLTPEALSELMSMRLGYGQTNGSIPLRNAIAQLYPAATAKHVLATTGSIEANFITIWSLLSPGDELILMLPNYMQVWGLARAFNIQIKPFYLDESLGWQPNFEKLAALISPKTKMIAVCHPNNPTGAILSEADMDRLVALAEKANAWLFADEIYRGAEIHGEEVPSFFGRYERAIVTGGLSKAYALPGLRIGWLVGPPAIIADLWSRRDYTTIATALMSQAVAHQILQPEMRSRVLGRNRKMLRRNLTHLQEWIASHGQALRMVPPQAGGMAFIHYDWPLSSKVLTDRLRLEQSTLIVPGESFGMEGWLRIGIGSEEDYLLAGLARIDRVLAELGKEPQS